MTIRLWARVAALIVATLFVAGASFAAAGRPNPNRGKSLFRSGCKSCHQAKGEAKDLSPLTKTQAQWTRAFKTNVPARMAPRVAQKAGKPLTPADLADIEFFLVSHAADSDQPETCGLK
jgi:mono/diheme cytochrome c family protein